jgi:hypothetical protein
MERMESSPLLCKQGVTGSIPVTSTKPFFSPFCNLGFDGDLRF